VASLFPKNKTDAFSEGRDGGVSKAWFEPVPGRVGVETITVSAEASRRSRRMFRKKHPPDGTPPLDRAGMAYRLRAAGYYRPLSANDRGMLSLLEEAHSCSRLGTWARDDR
jgi:hypothetical protein